MPHEVRAPEASRLERIAASFMAAHFVLQLGTGILLGGVFVGMGSLVGLMGAIEEELGAIAFGGLFGGVGVLLGIFLLVQAIPAAFAMWGMWRGSFWRQAAVVVAASLAITHFPVGTVLALGALWYTYLGHEAQKRASAG
jgi:hypothetical protein